MGTTEKNPTGTELQIRELAAQLRTHREHPCFLFVSRSIQHSDVLTVRRALGDETGDRAALLQTAACRNAFLGR